MKNASLARNLKLLISLLEQQYREQPANRPALRQNLTVCNRRLARVRADMERQHAQ